MIGIPAQPQEVDGLAAALGPRARVGLRRDHVERLGDERRADERQEPGAVVGHDARDRAALRHVLPDLDVRRLALATADDGRVLARRRAVEGIAVARGHRRTEPGDGVERPVPSRLARSTSMRRSAVCHGQEHARLAHVPSSCNLVRFGAVSPCSKIKRAGGERGKVELPMAPPDGGPAATWRSARTSCAPSPAVLVVELALRTLLPVPLFAPALRHGPAGARIMMLGRVQDDALRQEREGARLATRMDRHTRETYVENTTTHATSQHLRGTRMYPLEKPTGRHPHRPGLRRLLCFRRRGRRRLLLRGPAFEKRLALGRGARLRESQGTASTRPSCASGKEGPAYHPDVVVIGYVGTYRRATPSRSTFFYKPCFVLRRRAAGDLLAT